MERDASAAAAAMADIDAQQDAVRRRIDSQKWPPPALGLLLGVLAGSLAWRNIVLFVVVTVAYLASLLPLLGTPARLGVVPRDGRRSLPVVLVACLFVMVTPVIAMTGPWWTAIAAGVGAAVFVPVFGRWRRAQTRRDARGPAVLAPHFSTRRIDALASRPGFVPVAVVVMAGAVLGMWAGWHVAALAYLPGLLLLTRRQIRVGEIPAGQRTSRFRVGVLTSCVVLYGTPALGIFGSSQKNWVQAAGHAAVVSVIVALVGQWQQRRLTTEPSPR